MKYISYKLFFKAFANKTRFEIIELLIKAPKTVNQICKKLGYEQSRVSHNLKCLVDCGFIQNKRVGKTKVYSLDQKTIIPILKLVDTHIGKYSTHLKKCGAIKM